MRGPYNRDRQSTVIDLVDNPIISDTDSIGGFTANQLFDTQWSGLDG